jgi:hypothetical protein
VTRTRAGDRSLAITSLSPRRARRITRDLTGKYFPKAAPQGQGIGCHGEDLIPLHLQRRNYSINVVYFMVSHPRSFFIDFPVI